MFPAMSKQKIRKLQEELLNWYAQHRRVMPWRATEGKTPDPYHVWLSEIMLQQTTVVTVGPYFMKFIDKWPTVEALAAEKLDNVLTAWAGLGYYARARNLHKCAQAIVNEHNGKFPATPEELLELPGIGPYTAAAITSIAFNRPAVAVDGNVERVVSRFFAIEEPLPSSKEIIRAKAAKLAAENPQPRDFTQAFMELGSLVCTPRNPKCGLCPWREDCTARRRGIAEELPHMTPKAKKPVRYGKVFWIQKKSGEFLVEKKTAKGLYEGMYQLPTTEWTPSKTAAKKLLHPYDSQLRFKPLNMTVRHSFTHFNLILEIWTAPPHKNFKKQQGGFISVTEADDYALPTLMQKVMRACLKSKIA